MGRPFALPPAILGQIHKGVRRFFLICVKVGHCRPPLFILKREWI